MTKTSEKQFEFYLVNSYYDITVKPYIVLKNKLDTYIVAPNTPEWKRKVKEILKINKIIEEILSAKEVDQEINKSFNKSKYEKADSLDLYYNVLNLTSDGLYELEKTTITPKKPQSFNRTIKKYVGMKGKLDSGVIMIRHEFEISLNNDNNKYSTFNELKQRFREINEKNVNRIYKKEELPIYGYKIKTAVFSRHYVKNNSSNQDPGQPFLNLVNKLYELQNFLISSTKTTNIPKDIYGINIDCISLKKYYSNFACIDKDYLLKFNSVVYYNSDESKCLILEQHLISKQCCSFDHDYIRKDPNRLKKLHMYNLTADFGKYTQYCCNKFSKTFYQDLIKEEFGDVTYFYDSSYKVYKVEIKQTNIEICIDFKHSFVIKNIFLILLQNIREYTHNKENFLKWMQCTNTYLEAQNCINNTPAQFKKFIKFDRIFIIKPEMLKQAYDQSSLKQLVATQDIKNLDASLQAVEKILSLFVVFITNNPIDKNGFDLIHKESRYKNIICELFNIYANYMHYLNSLIKHCNDQYFKDIGKFDCRYYRDNTEIDKLTGHDSELTKVILMQMGVDKNSLSGYVIIKDVIIHIKRIIKLYQATKDQAMKVSQNNEDEIHKVEADNTPALQLTPANDMNEGHMEEAGEGNEGHMEDPNPAEQNVAGAEHAYQSSE